MAQIVVIGSGLAGLTAGMLLARDGHQVTVTERDAAGPRGRAGDVWQRWDRRGVNQFRQLHFMLPRWRAVMERELPEVIAELEALGGVRTSMLGALPDEMTGGKRDGDERFETVTGRRPVLEAAVAQAAKCTDGLTVCRGVAVTGLVTGTESIAGVPHVAGVTIGGATEVHADLVVDAAGRRSPVSGMLAAIGARRPDEEKEDCGFVYYARHFRSPDGSCPPAMERLLQHFEGVSILTLPCDSGTWGVGLVTSARDRELRALRAVPAWEAALALFPNVAHWGAAQPITGVQVIAGIEDRHRRHVVDGEPVATGLAAIGDAWACTNPSLGRGASIGLLHACTLRDLLREVGPDEPERLARRFDEVTQATVGPYYRATLEFDRHRLAEINGEITGQPYQPDDPAWEISKALYAAAAYDPDVLRAYTSVAAMTALPRDALAEPGMLDKVISLGSTAPRYSATGPPRAELLDALAPYT
jgi:2-polyprenyl-6-methoxyphenol hydroxylase-like FAD-dependent oxidoreductase